MLTVLYPLLIWFGQDKVEPRWLAALLLLAAASRLPAWRASRASGASRASRASRVARWSGAGALALAGVAVWANAMLPLKLYPVLVSVALLGAFGYTLAVPPSMAERLARLREPDLPPAAIGYTRRVTQMWCVFFFVNGALALGTALWASPAIWTLYTGVIAYLLMGLLFGGEYLVRMRFKRRRAQDV